MTKLDSEKEKYFKTVKNLEEILKEKKNEINRDSAIKRFELCFDVAWKIIKEYLLEYKGVICASPNDCFKEAYRQSLIEYSDFWIDMTKKRNSAVHTYDEKLADLLYAELPKFLASFQKLEKKIKELTD